MTAFNGFGKDALGFFTALKFHQDKAWFENNKALYQSDVLDPMEALLGELTTVFARKRIPLQANGKRSIFRIYRDVRFAKDKSPYKTHAGAVMTRSGAKMDRGLLYLHIDPDGCFVACGFYQLEPPALAKMRRAIAADNKAFGRVLAALKKGGLELETRSQLTRVPRGFEALKDSPLSGVIRLKSFIVEESLPDSVVTTRKLADAIIDFTKRAQPLLSFGWAALD